MKGEKTENGTFQDYVKTEMEVKALSLLEDGKIPRSEFDSKMNNYYPHLENPSEYFKENSIIEIVTKRKWPNCLQKLGKKLKTFYVH